MTELLAAPVISPEIGDVLASIRRLIAQDDQTPDFASLTRRTDARGAPRSTLPLGPRAERLRSVIERELNGAQLAEDRLVLGGDARAAPPLIGPHEPADALQGFDEAAYQSALRDGRGAGGAENAAITPIISRQNAETKQTVQESEMMLAEVNSASFQEEAMVLQPRGHFDLFASDATDDDDQIAGGNALRNLVRDVIRQELQGEMGERISRNLRRMVRQEVAAAITAGMKTT